MSSRKPTLPNLLIIGAGKAGTTSLHRYLSLHPEIYMSKNKELSFFDDERQWHMGVEWYKSNFDANYPINGEASPRYARYPLQKGVPMRIHATLGAPKLIYILRDPVDRILSQYTQLVDDWLDIPPFDQYLSGIEHSSNGFIQVSSYFMQISKYLELFPRESILVVINERLSARPTETLQEIFRFLEVDAAFWSPEFESRRNVGEKKKHIAPWFSRWSPRAIRELLPPTPSRLHWRLKRALYLVSRIGARPIEKPRLSLEADLKIQDLLRADVAALREFLGDPLPEWRPYA